MFLRVFMHLGKHTSFLKENLGWGQHSNFPCFLYRYKNKCIYLNYTLFLIHFADCSKERRVRQCHSFSKILQNFTLNSYAILYYVKLPARDRLARKPKQGGML
jgi:hypothetical protein